MSSSRSAVPFPGARLQRLVRVVDQKLLEAVPLEDLEAEDVQDADAVVGFAGRGAAAERGAERGDDRPVT